MSERTCYFALGTNLGNRLQNLSRARELLSEKVIIRKVSSVYETEPWGVTDQPRFLNQVVEGETDLEAFELLRFLKQLEETLGRKKTIRYGPRLIDLDILILGNLTLNTPDLTIPHARLTERAFVLVPLAEIAPDLILPGTQKSIPELLTHVDASGVRLFEGEA